MEYNKEKTVKHFVGERILIYDRTNMYTYELILEYNGI